MANEQRIVRPGAHGQLIGQEGELLSPPASWIFLPAGDAGITRKVTAQGQFWRVEVKKGRRTMSLGIWAPEKTIAQAKKQVQEVRLTDDYKKKQASALQRREKKQVEYDAEFFQAVERFLHFHSSYKDLEQTLARAVTVHAIPVGSGTVARTQMIPIEERAALAVIAWMRHQTTGYDNLTIARVKGERRAVRRSLAQQSAALLANYREGRMMDPKICPLHRALRKLS